jgi:hypothetical protein
MRPNFWPRQAKTVGAAVWKYQNNDKPLIMLDGWWLSSPRTGTKGRQKPNGIHRVLRLWPKVWERSPGGGENKSGVPGAGEAPSTKAHHGETAHHGAVAYMSQLQNWDGAVNYWVLRADF